MKSRTLAMGLAVMGLIAMAPAGFAGLQKTVRATELTARIWSDFDQGATQELLVEFRQGDRLPITLQAEGDLIETSEVYPSYVVVKRAFWLKVEQNQILLSMDGSSFRPFNQVLDGSFTAGVVPPQGGTASAINLLFKAHLK